MAHTSTPQAWDEDPAGASLLIATGRPKHDLLVFSEATFLTDLPHAWGSAESTVRSSFLPGVSSPASAGHHDGVSTWMRDGVSVLVSHGHTTSHEGLTPRRTTALARLAIAARPAYALVFTRVTSLGHVPAGTLVPIVDYLSVAEVPTVPGSQMRSATLTVDDVRAATTRVNPDLLGPDVMAGWWPSSVYPGQAQMHLYASLGADVVAYDGLPHALTLASAGIPTALVGVVDRLVPAYTRRSRRAQDPQAGDQTAQAQSSVSAAVSVPVELRVTRIIESLCTRVRTQQAANLEGI